MEVTLAQARDALLPDGPNYAVRYLARAAMWAPSVQNTQPWRFGFRGMEVSLDADVERVLKTSDPDGREAVISCGAALFTMRVAIRHLGYEPEVWLLPDPQRSTLLARVRWGRTLPATEHAKQLYRGIARRRSHRGAFARIPLSRQLLDALREDATREGATLRIVDDESRVAALATLVQAGERLQRLDPAYVAEAARWALPPGSRRGDGVPDTAYPMHPEPMSPEFPGRDFARGHEWGVRRTPLDPEQLSPGVAALLTTREDQRIDWIRAGQALQRLLLRAASHGVSAAFHTQPLEIPELRTVIRERFCGGHHPQVLLRLGVAVYEGASVRRSPAEVLYERK